LVLSLIYFSDIVSVQDFVNAGMAILIVPSMVVALLMFRYINKHTIN
jgi:hypothetical protein